VTHTVFIDLDSHVATASATGTAAPDVPLKHLTKQKLAFAFHSGGTVAAVTGWSTGRVVIKATPTSDVLLLDTTLAATGSTTSTRYSAEWAAVDCDSAALRTLIGASVEPLDVFAEIQWTADSGTYAVAFPIQIVPTFNLPEDAPPDPTSDAAWEWIKARLAAGSNITFTDNDTTQVRTIAASGGGGGGGGGSVDWGDIDGTLSDQTDLQTALNNKQPLAAALTTLSSATAAGLALMDDANAAAQRTTLGLGNVDNTSDASKPISSATQSALDAKVTGPSSAVNNALPLYDGTTGKLIKDSGVAPSADVLTMLGAANNDALNAIFGLLPYSTVSGAATLVAGRRYLVRPTSSYTLTLPSTAFVGDTLYLIKSADTWSASPLTIDSGSGNTITNYTSAAQTLSYFSPGWTPEALSVLKITCVNRRFSGGIPVVTNNDWYAEPLNYSTMPGAINNATKLALVAGVGATGGVAAHTTSVALRIPIFFSDQSTDWTTGLKVTFTWRFGATTLSSTPIDCVTAPTGSAAQFDVKKNGTTIYSTKPTIDASETSTGTAATPAVLSTTSLANGDIVTIWIDQIGSTIKGQGGVLTFVGTTIP
jgi:hypothetical protein